ncbi:SAM-dependent methyltransferase [Actinomycetospora rhizophila]|uniref:SAM-dependent methyltransferase n=1 Tax=Actinomycetospora rhizophila TaxID=1416876 RepID=A0ABV9ZF33_9PSEU
MTAQSGGPAGGRWRESERALEAGIDFERANAARIYDYLLGGACNFAVDREQAARILAQNPDMADVCRANRDFLRRAVEWCLAHGITQFLDLGSGVPTAGNVHEIALAHRPEARVAYVDFEPVAVAHAHEVVGGLENVSVTRADMRDTHGVLAAPGVRDLLDPDRPIALLTVAVLHFVPDPELPAILARYRAAMTSGSAHVMSHGSADHDDPELAARTRAIQDGYRGSATEVVLRSRPEIRDLLGDTELVAPGLVDIVDWPTASPGERPTGGYAAIARIH